MATPKELLTSRIILRAVLPVIKVLLEDDPAMAKKFKDVTAIVRFTARDESGPVSAYLKFDKGAFEVVQGVAEKADITFWFWNVKFMNDMLLGKIPLPIIIGFWKVGLLLKVMSVLMGLKLLMPNARPKEYERKKQARRKA